MKTFHTKIDDRGRIVLPAKCREELHFKPQAEVIIQENGEGIAHLYTLETAVRRAQEKVAKYTKGKKNLLKVLKEIR